MMRFKDKYRVESARLRGWDYAAAAWYFVTICTKDRACSFGDVIGGDMRLSPIGEIAHQYWDDIPRHFPNVRLDAYVIMPNHLHGIVVIENRDVLNTDHCRDVACNVSTQACDISTMSSPTDDIMSKISPNPGLWVSLYGHINLL